MAARRGKLNLADYALIIEPDPAQAAQYSYVIEQRGIVPVVAATGAEALFEVRRLGPPSLIVTEASLRYDDGLAVLSEIRFEVSPQTAPAVVIVDSRETHNAAARSMIKLGISVLLPRLHKLTAFEQAIDRTLKREPPEPAGFPPSPLPGSQGSPPEVPARMAADPLVQQLAEMPGLHNVSSEDLRQLANSTAQAFGAAIVLIWLDLGNRSFFELHLAPTVDEKSPLRVVSRWASVRRLIGDRLLEVRDVAEHAAFAGTPLLPGGLSAALVGAPLTLDGALVGAIAVVQPRVVGRLPAGRAEVLLFWAQRISGDLERMRPGLRDLVPPRGPSRSISPTAALESLANTIDLGFMISDDSGLICVANPALSVHLGLEDALPIGQRRAAVLRRLASARGVEDGVVSAIVGASHVSPRGFDFVVRAPQERVLRWRSRSIDLHDRQGLLDEFSDVTPEAEQARASDALIRVDAFTGLPNRVAIMDEIGRETARALRTGDPFSVAVFALDHLQSGDGGRGMEAFRNVARTLRATARRYDLAARLDHSRLLVLVCESTADQALVFCERFASEVRSTTLPNLPPATVSGGVAQFQLGRGVQELLDGASAKLSEARRMGGDRIVG